MTGGGSPDRLRIERESGSAEDVTLKLLGELDLVTAPGLRAELARHHAEGRRVVLDLSQIEFLDSTGLVLLMEAARGEGEVLLRRDLSPPVERLFQVTKTERLFAWAD